VQRPEIGDPVFKPADLYHADAIGLHRIASL
jgi:hypothetical protein